MSNFTKYNVVKLVEVGTGAGYKKLWLPVGKITIWPGDGKGKKASGKLRLNIFGDVEYHVFEDDGTSNSESRRTGTPLDKDDIPI